MKHYVMTIIAGLLFVGLTACAQNSKKTEVTNNGKVLVAYFSATGTTKNVAEKIAAETSGKLLEITPSQPYTAADLNWRDKASRSSVEMNDSNSRPSIKANGINTADYDTIFIGYPIWWDLAPRVINTFIESNNLKGKTVIPFATSGGSSITNSVKVLKETYPDINFKDGKLLNNVGNKHILKEFGI